MDKVIFKKNEADIAWRIIDEETAIIPLNQNKSKDSMIILNQTATKIWELINGKNANNDILKKILHEYDVSPSEAKNQIEKIIIYLFRKNIVKKC